MGSTTLPNCYSTLHSVRVFSSILALKIHFDGSNLFDMVIKLHGFRILGSMALVIGIHIFQFLSHRSRAKHYRQKRSTLIVSTIFIFHHRHLLRSLSNELHTFDENGLNVYNFVGLVVLMIGLDILAIVIDWYGSNFLDFVTDWTGSNHF